MSNTLAILNSKGGVGRTTTTVKLASIFVHLDYRGMPVLQRNVENKCTDSGL